MLQLQERSAAGSARSSGVFSRTVRILAELLITTGMVLLLFIAWQLWWTNLESESSQREVIDGFAREFKGSGAPLAQPTEVVGYGHLPGHLWLRIVTSLVLAAGVLVLMVKFLFPGWHNSPSSPIQRLVRQGTHEHNQDSGRR